MGNHEMTARQTTIKSIDEHFIDWEGSAFGFGYGTGEPHILSALRRFFEILENERSYDYRNMEAEFGPLSAWLLINALATRNGNVIDYGTSSRFGWITTAGEKLRDFVMSPSADELVEMVCSTTEDYIHCYPDACSCGPNGYVEGRKCNNPFWESP